MRIQLQRDMMYWDSGGTTKTPKRLNIANIDKLVGCVTSHTGWICNKATEYTETYDMLFNSIKGGTGTSMDVRVIKEGQLGYTGGGTSYIVEIRQLIKSDNNSHSYYHSKPTAYSIDECIFTRAKTFSNWLDNKLTAKRIEVADELWNEKPWYKKLIVKISDFLPKNVNPKSGTKRITAKKAAP